MKYICTFHLLRGLRELMSTAINWGHKYPMNLQVGLESAEMSHLHVVRPKLYDKVWGLQGLCVFFSFTPFRASLQLG